MASGLPHLSSCTVGSFKNKFKDTDNGIAFYSQPGCPACEEARRILKVIALQKRARLIEIPIATTECSKLADVHKITETPTAVMVRRGKITNTIKFGGRTAEGAVTVVIKSLNKNKKKPKAPPISADQLRKEVMGALKSLQTMGVER